MADFRLLGLTAEEVCGRGAGLSDSGFQKKLNVIKKAIEKYDIYNQDVYKIIQTVGGFDIAAMIGVYLGAKKCGLPVILDGAISLAAALAAVRIDAEVKDFLLPSHKSREEVAEKIALALGKDFTPVIDGNMALGEGTGAVMMLGLLRTALEVYNNALKFEDSGVGQYKRNAQ